MSFRGCTTIVASPRLRVGKTLLARLLTDFHLHEGRSVVAYDLNAGERTLAQFLPKKTTIATIRDVNDQMALFDRPSQTRTPPRSSISNMNRSSHFLRGLIRLDLSSDAAFVIAICATASRRRRWRQCTTKCLDPRNAATNIRSPVEAQ